MKYVVPNAQMNDQGFEDLKSKFNSPSSTSSYDKIVLS